MKYNFIVSAFRKTWIKEIKYLFLTDPYVFHVLGKNNELRKYSEIKVAPYPRLSRKEFIHDHNFIEQKYYKYLPVLANRLNEIHQTDYKIIFWQKCFSIALVRYITFLYDTFQTCEKYFNPALHGCKVLSENSYFTPRDFDDHRQFFQHSDYGQEQIFSIYLHLFFPSHLNTIEANYKSKSQDVSVSSLPFTRFSKLLYDKELLRKLLWKFYSSRQPHVGILQSYFSKKYFLDLVIRSKGKINSIPLKDQFDISETIDNGKREMLLSGTEELDKFDQFFFESLKYCLPKIFIEGFEQVVSYYFDYFSKYKNLQFVVSEAWIGNNYPAIALAVLQKMGVRHIYNEHNWLSHQFLGNNHKYIFPVVDSYVTMGWEDPNIPNLVKGASLFGWSVDAEHTKRNNILFITTVPQVHPAEVNAGYGVSGPRNVEAFFEFNRTFFKSLKTETLKEFVIRGYPKHKAQNFLSYDQYFELEIYYSQCKKVDCKSKTAQKLMKKAKLIIVNHLSTSYMEALISNIPVIFFWNPEVYYLEEEYNDFYEPLIKVGICQTIPEKAAHFIEKIKDAPDVWWSKPEVQNAKDEFLNKNFGDPKDMLDYLVDLSC